MILRAATALLLLGALAVPALADGYPVSGRWGQSASTSKGPIECHGRRVITFRGEQRFDTGGGVPAYHIKSVRTDGSDRWRIVDQFTTGQIRAAQDHLHAGEDRRRPHRARSAGRQHTQTATMQVDG